MLPGTEKLDSLLGDLLSLEEGLEHFLAEQVFERSEVDVLRHGVEDSVAMDLDRDRWLDRVAQNVARGDGDGVRSDRQGHSAALERAVRPDSDRDVGGLPVDEHRESPKAAQHVRDTPCDGDLALRDHRAVDGLVDVDGRRSTVLDDLDYARSASLSRLVDRDGVQSVQSVALELHVYGEL